MNNENIIHHSPLPAHIKKNVSSSFFNSLLVVPIGGLGLAIALVLPLTIGAAVNVSVAIAAYTIIKRSMMV
ncbi:MAG: hypothetical protein M1395_10055 [Bacteroidetes bacterium]|nr:hypothetical protein [Bacteroidota bacterium]